MKLLDILSKVISQNQERPFKDLHGFILCILGAGTFVGAGYWGLMLKDIILPLITATNKADISLYGFSLWLLFGVYAGAVWFFGCIAARCHAVLYERWFK